MNYSRLTSRHADLLKRHTNATVELGVVTYTGGDEFNPPTQTTEWTPVDAVVSGVGSEWVDGSQVLASDLTVQLGDVSAPAVGDVIRVDGKSMSVQEVKPLRSGVGYILRCRG